MFGLFGKKEATIKVKDKVWVTGEAKLQAFINEWKKNPGIVFIFWFDESLRQVESFFAGQATTAPVLLTARETNTFHLAGKKIIVAEHYPLQQKENEFFQKLNLQEAEIWSALDEPLFKHFGSEKIIQMMKQLGMKENEVIENAMISKAILSVQEKISKKIIIDQAAQSQDDWLQKNLNA
ncbi:MAG TPA: hypothetical protein VKC90_02605 [Chitinophagaceae bacterium]|nr:hypothetical protein [Chitinophagaceae bacterium]